MRTVHAAALAVVAPFLGAGQADVLTQQVQQRRPGVDFQRPFHAVQAQSELCHAKHLTYLRKPVDSR
jgi:hypothetical protein